MKEQSNVQITTAFESFWNRPDILTADDYRLGRRPMRLFSQRERDCLSVSTQGYLWSLLHGGIVNADEFEAFMAQLSLNHLHQDLTVQDVLIILQRVLADPTRLQLIAKNLIQH